MIYYEHDQQFITVIGQTYPHRNTFKDMGAFFVGALKAWRLPYSAETLQNVDQICRQLGGGPSSASFTTESIGPALKDESSVLETSQEIVSSSSSSSAEGYRISELLDLVSATISTRFTSPLWIMGEVQNLNIRAGRVYFNLAEQANTESTGSTLSISAVIWNDSFKRLERKLGKEALQSLLQEGLLLRLLCQVQFYKGRASLTLNILDIDPQYTQGALALAREVLLRTLRSKGLDVANKNTVLNAFPFEIGLISAENSRAASDFLHQLEQGAFCGSIRFCPAAMQGEQAPKEVCAALKTLTLAGCDLIVLTRGGGSAADLRWFDTPEMAYAIAECPIPVLAAIGHHDDRCVAEEICFQREKTPTAAAEFILKTFQKTSERIDLCLSKMEQRIDEAVDRLFDKQHLFQERVRSAATQVLMKKQEALGKLTYDLDHHSMRRVNGCEQKLMQQIYHLQSQSHIRLERFSHALQSLEQTLKAQDPQPWLQKGWTQLWKGKQQVRSVEEVSEGSEVWTRLLDGILELEVIRKQKKSPQKET